MYSSAFCPYCVQARLLLGRKKADVTVISVAGRPERWEEMVSRGGRETVPQIFIDDYHVGGFDDLRALDRGGRLDPLLNEH